ncbi:molybdopterin-dependent oxidoreductase [Mesorhizobium mediterraneum]|uniref:molybdopterin-dependent oxidoreductase n=1 Tax=Mesorhizobium mediterraneum TaxID=43617 RepID=UPI00177BC5E5|nr:molybdopterin-dependent oxidoreductase [Mesorhizobium mediterraneum]
MTDRRNYVSHSAHWGAFSAAWDGNALDVVPHPADRDPSPILGNLRNALRHPARILRPAVRRSWLERGPGSGPRPLNDEFVEMDWDKILPLAAGELSRVSGEHGPEAVYGGSYGWASAGRFHHALSQVHRFLNVALGGFVRSVHSYSAGASSVIIPRVMGQFESVTRRNITWAQIEEHTDMVLAFGGMAVKNSMIAAGGVTTHIERGAMDRASQRGVAFHLFSPLRDDFPPEARATWHPVQPGTDVAVMLGMAHTLLTENLHDGDFIGRCCEGADVFFAYVLGQTDGVAKTPAWAAELSGVPAQTIAAVARKMVACRSLVTVSHSMQRARYGEQPVWAAMALAAMAGQIGLPGGGYNYSLGAMGHTGRQLNAVPLPTMPQGRNGVANFIPCARVSDMLLSPGQEYDFDGKRMVYPDIRLVYWAGGNPFHHHQDLNRLRRAFSVPETIIVHDNVWTATARSADIVFPATMTLERDDIGAAGTDPRLIAMRTAVAPAGLARDDHDIFADMTDVLGKRDLFTEGRQPREWLEHLYEPTRQALQARGRHAPAFAEFWERGEIELPSEPDDGGVLRAFRADPDGHPMPTPSGRLELGSTTISDFAYEDCRAHPAWFAPDEQPTSKYPLVVVANQPATRLHSQLDFGDYSQAAKIRDREALRIHPLDAAARGIRTGDAVKVFNDRGACLAGALVTDMVMPGVVNLPTGAWYDPVEIDGGSTVCVNGNPNVLTRDIGTSKLAQGCCGQVTIADVAIWEGELPEIRAYGPPPLVSGKDGDLLPGLG